MVSHSIVHIVELLKMLPSIVLHHIVVLG